MVLQSKTCEHLDAISETRTAANYECEECVKTGSSWVHLRTCQQCGVTLCCDSSRNKHARKHAIRHEHPVISSAEPGERWLFCYIDNTMKRY